MNDYKTTLNLPETLFPMRGYLTKNEPEILKKWIQDNLYKLVRHAKKGKKIFIIHDGPPYANGNLHIGHAVNKILKDIIVKFKGLDGFDVPYIPGWDCHGLPIELEVERQLNKHKQEYTNTEFRKRCRCYAYEQITIQKNDFIRMGVLADWLTPYLTMEFQTEANIIRTLAKVVEHGYLYRGSKPVYWCIKCASSLAEAEVEYHDKVSSAIDVKFAAVDCLSVLNKFGISDIDKNISIIIWTTTPWTLPANRGIALHPSYEYQLIQTEKECFILAALLVEKVMQRVGIKQWVILGSVIGKDLIGLYFKHPFMGFNVPVVLGEHVTVDTGTGAVHTAPGHGSEDYEIGCKYNLEIANPIDDQGCYVKGTYSKLDGMLVFDANNVVLEILCEKEALLHSENLQHSYPFCWRHKTPVIFRATPQWFIGMDVKNLRKKALMEIIKIGQQSINHNGLYGWIPAWGEARIASMVEQRPDWCISRQRIWGVPMALFVHRETKKLHPNSIALMEKIAKRVEKDGVQAWWDLEIEEVLEPEESVVYEKINDILDVWFDSGSTNFSVVEYRKEFGGQLPDLYFEGSDQHRGWFMSSLILSTAIRDKAPYKQVITHGFVVDGQGKKMSKSVGNVISPQEVMGKFGADILRLWVASTNYTNEIAISDEILKHAADSYRRIRNTVRFLLANLKGFNPSRDCVEKEQMVVLDRWAVGRAQLIQQEIIAAYQRYDFHIVVQRIVQFCSVEMGSFYLDIIKDRQYTAKTGSLAHRSCQTALFHIVEAIVRWIAPVLSFTANEIWGYLPGKRSNYVFAEEWYQGLFGLDKNEKLNNDFWEEVLRVRSEVYKVLEYKRKNKLFGSFLEVGVTLYADAILAGKLKQLGDELRFIFITSRANVLALSELANNSSEYDSISPELKVSVSLLDGDKCPRCWHRSSEIGRDKIHPLLCSRCVLNVSGCGEKRRFA